MANNCVLSCSFWFGSAREATDCCKTIELKDKMCREENERVFMGSAARPLIIDDLSVDEDTILMTADVRHWLEHNEFAEIVQYLKAMGMTGCEVTLNETLGQAYGEYSYSSDDNICVFTELPLEHYPREFDEDGNDTLLQGFGEALLDALTEHGVRKEMPLEEALITK